jgi:hypothetical protein
MSISRAGALRGDEASGHDAQGGMPETGPEATHKGQGPDQEKPPISEAEKTKDKR